MTWQGRNAVDDDGDGAPDVLDRGVPVRLDRVYAGDGLPAGFATREAPVLSWLARTRKRFDVTTDVAIAQGRGPRLEGHRGVLLAGDARWLPAALQQRLRALRAPRRAGGHARRRLAAPAGAPDAADAPARPHAAAPAPTCSARRCARLRRAPGTTLTNERDDVGLFDGDERGLHGLHAYESVAGLPAARAWPRARSPSAGSRRPVIAATRLGSGLVIRFGLPDLATHLGDDADDAGRRAAGTDVDAPVPLIAVAALAAAALVLRGDRARARLGDAGALVLAPAILVSHIWDTDQVRPLRDHPRWPRRRAVGAVVAAGRAGRALRPPPGAAAARGRGDAPVPVPIASGGSTANLLVPLYLVVARGRARLRGAAAAGRRRRPDAPWPRARSSGRWPPTSCSTRSRPPPPRLRPRAGERRLLLRAVRAAVRRCCAGVAWTPRLARAASACSSSSRWRSSGVGFVEYATRHLFLNPKVIASNQFEDYFRVNSLFFDPNIYGRFLAVVMVLVAAWLLWARRPREVVAGAAAARGAVGRARADLLAVELRRAAGRAGRAGRAALARALARDRRRRARAPASAFVAAGARRGPARPRQLEVGRQGDERPLRPHRGRRAAVRRARRWSG